MRLAVVTERRERLRNFNQKVLDKPYGYGMMDSDGRYKDADQTKLKENDDDSKEEACN